jgi:hypothetical protein
LDEVGEGVGLSVVSVVVVEGLVAAPMKRAGDEPYVELS